MLPISWSPADAQLKSFARIWWPLFVLFVTALLYRGSGWTTPVLVVTGAGVALAIASAVSHTVARTVFLGLHVITFPLAFVTSTIVLAVIYYLVVTPIGLVLRLAGRDALSLRKRKAASLWVPVPDRTDAERAFRQF